MKFLNSLFSPRASVSNHSVLNSQKNLTWSFFTLWCLTSSSNNVEISSNQTISKVKVYELCITVDATEVRIASNGGHDITWLQVGNDRWRCVSYTPINAHLCFICALRSTTNSKRRPSSCAKTPHSGLLSFSFCSLVSRVQTCVLVWHVLRELVAGNRKRLRRTNSLLNEVFTILSINDQVRSFQSVN